MRANTGFNVAGISGWGVTGGGVTGGSTDNFAWIATVLCMGGLIMTLGGSSLGAVLFIAVWGVVAVARAERCLRMLLRSPGIWLIPAFATASVLWSVAPLVTLRAAIELAVTIAGASLAAGFLLPRAFVSAMSVSLLFGAILSLLFGRYAFDGETGAVVFVGIFASKYTMAAFMSFLAIFSAAALLDRGQPGALRLLSVFAFLLSVPLLLRAQSAGALLTTAGSLVVLLLTAIFARLPRRDRLLVVSGAAALIVPLSLVVLLLAINGTLGDDWSSFLTGVLGKDATMTGRTMLWQIALAEIAKRPFEGTGYYAFWMQGNLVAESIWRYFQIMNRSGFSFHDTFLEFAVELGWPGLALLVIALAVMCQRTVRLALADQTWATAALVAMVFCLVTRTIGEVDVPYPFSAGTFLLYVAAAYGADYAMAVQHGRRLARLAPPTWDMMPSGLPGRGLSAGLAPGLASGLAPGMSNGLSIGQSPRRP